MCPETIRPFDPSLMNDEPLMKSYDGIIRRIRSLGACPWHILLSLFLYFHFLFALPYLSTMTNIFEAKN